MFLVWVGAALTTAIAIAEPFLGGPQNSGGTPVPAASPGASPSGSG
jgi:K+-transporting ATPase ATPase B chain